MQVMHKITNTNNKTNIFNLAIPRYGMATLSSIFVWRIPMARGAWQTTFHMLPKLDTAGQLSTPLKVE